MSDLNLRIAISIHALREEGDAGPAFPRCRPAISIHALREEGDAAKSMWNAQPAEFLSTPSARRATLCFRVCDSFVSISIHALREEGDLRYPRPPAHQGISIHALREEGDPDYRLQDNDYSKFLSTPSARRATLSSMAKILRMLLFLSTPSARRATPVCNELYYYL